MGFKDGLKRTFQNLTKNLPEPTNNLPKTEQNQPQTNQNQTQNNTATLPETYPTITLNSAGKISDFPLRVFGVVGKMGYGKTTLVNAIAKYYGDNGIPQITVNTIADLEKTDCLLIIDDLKDDIAKTVFKKIVEDFRVVRHRRQIIIIAHQLLDDFPTDLLKLSEKVIMFNNSFSINPLTGKVGNIIAKTQIQSLHDKALELTQYRYVVIKEGKVFGDYENTDIIPIVGDTNGTEIKLIGKATQKNAEATITNKPLLMNASSNKLLDIIKQKCPEYDYLTVNEKIIVIKQSFPRLKPRVITRIVGTTDAMTWKTLSNARKTKKLPQKKRKKTPKPTPQPQIATQIIQPKSEVLTISPQIF